MVTKIDSSSGHVPSPRGFESQSFPKIIYGRHLECGVPSPRDLVPPILVPATLQQPAVFTCSPRAHANDELATKRVSSVGMGGLIEGLQAPSSTQPEMCQHS